ncbi:MAG: hypothetical protein V4627_16975 [Pseudomonadota bacterium]
MVFKRILSSFLFLACGGLAYAQSLTTNIVVTGTTDSLTFNAAVAPSGAFLNNGSKLWMAIIKGEQVYFFNDTMGFVPYAGGLRLLTSGNPAEAPAVRTITKSTETIYLAGWNTRSILGSEVFIGYGSSFAELVRNVRYTKLYTFVEKAAPRLDDFYGRLTLMYKFKNSSTIYTDVANFSAGNISTSGSTTTVVNYIVGSTSRAMSCAVSPSAASYSHLCAIASLSGETELFAFNLSNGNITAGAYTYCSPYVSVSACATEVLTNPDGTVWGTVVNNMTPLSVSPVPLPASATIEHAKSETNAATVADGGSATQPAGLSTELSTSFEALIKQANGARK